MSQRSKIETPSRCSTLEASIKTLDNAAAPFDTVSLSTPMEPVESSVNQLRTKHILSRATTRTRSTGQSLWLRSTDGGINGQLAEVNQLCPPQQQTGHPKRYWWSPARRVRSSESSAKNVRSPTTRSSNWRIMVTNTPTLVHEARERRHYDELRWRSQSTCFLAKHQIYPRAHTLFQK